MKRPAGVTVIACLYLFVAFSMLIALVPTPAFNPLQRPGRSAVIAGDLVFAATLGVGLLRMKGWSRWLAIIAGGLQLLFVPREIALSHSPVIITRAGLRILFFIWVIWYLTRPQIKDAFRRS